MTGPYQSQEEEQVASRSSGSLDPARPDHGSHRHGGHRALGIGESSHSPPPPRGRLSLPGGELSRGGGGGHSLFELGYQLRETTAPLFFLAKDSPRFCHLQIYSTPIFMDTKNSPLKSKFSQAVCIVYIIFYHIIVLKGFKNKSECIQLLFAIDKFDAKTLTAPLSYNIIRGQPHFLAISRRDSHCSAAVRPQSVPFYRPSTSSPPGELWEERQVEGLKWEWEEALRKGSTEVNLVPYSFDIYLAKLGNSYLEHKHYG